MRTGTKRVQKDIETLARFTSTPGKGVTCSSYSRGDTIAKYYLAGEMKKIGLEIYEDGFGTLFGRREGVMKDAPIIMPGSHYGSVVNGEAFDGVAGSVPALGVMHVLTEEGFMNDYPLELILVNAEEGATFGPGIDTSNSKVMLETMIRRELETTKNRLGQTKLKVTAEYGLKPDLKAAIRKPGSVKNFLELHIEQGPVLKRGDIEIGLVRCLVEIGRHIIHFHGATADPTIPMDSRKDTLIAATSFIAEFDGQVEVPGPDVTGMVGRLDITPNSNQFVPEYVEGKIEIRTFSRGCIEKTNFKELITAILNVVSAEYGIRAELGKITGINYSNPAGPSVMCARDMTGMKIIYEELGYSHMIINNGAGHDSTIMMDLCDTNMIYVPSDHDGVSHYPEEWTEYASIKKGADVLPHLVMNLSKNK